MSGNPNIPRYFALGRYQMLSPALTDTGYLDQSGRWTGKNGIRSYRDFLNSPNIQDKAIQEYQGTLERQLTNAGAMKHVGQKIEGIKADITVTRAALLAAAHRQGAGKVGDYLKHLNSHDWKSSAGTFPELDRAKFVSVETRMRLHQNDVLP